MVYQDVMRNENISIEAKAIYGYLSSLSGKGCVCYPSIDTICRDLNIGRNRLSKHLNQLIALGVVEKTRERAGNVYGRNLYKVTHEVEVAKELNCIFEAIENQALDNKALDGEVLENQATNNNSINNNSLNNNSKKKNICPEPETLPPDPSGILLPLVDKTTYNVSLSKIKKWTAAFPAVDVTQELYKMAAWLESNPQRRKTRRGIDRFINNWLSREQDKGGRYRQPASAEPQLSPNRQQIIENSQKHYDWPECPDGPFQ